MYVYNALRNLASSIGWLRSEFTLLAGSIKNVYIIGQYLSSWFLSIAGYFHTLENDAYTLAAEWYGFYNQISASLGSSGVLQDLLRYADDLLSFIQDPFTWIYDALRDSSPDLRSLLQDPIAYILETIYNYTGLNYDFVNRPYQYIQAIVNAAVGDLQEIAGDPQGWLWRTLNTLIPEVIDFAQDSEGFIINKLQRAYPEVAEFLGDPEGYIIERIEKGIINFVENSVDKIVQLSEKILHKIF